MKKREQVVVYYVDKNTGKIIQGSPANTKTGVTDEKYDFPLPNILGYVSAVNDVPTIKIQMVRK